LDNTALRLLTRRSSARRHLGAWIKRLVRRSLARELFLFPRVVNDLALPVPQIGGILPLRYTYRASDEGMLDYEVLTSGTDVEYRLQTMTFHDMRPTPGSDCLSFTVPQVMQGDLISVGLYSSLAQLNGNPIAVTSHAYSISRKYIAHLAVSTGTGLLQRTCSHYLPMADKGVGKDYYFGDDYIDYPRHTRVEPAVSLVSEYVPNGRLLDVGCALGLYTRGFLEAGFDAYGIDASEFAVAEARRLAGEKRIQICNVDLSDPPFEGSFDILWMWDVLEHARDPQQMLARLTNKSARKAWLFLRTSNSESLSHTILGRDWEGYSDYSHLGVDQVSADSLRGWLKTLGWDIVKWECSDVWVRGVDPVLLRLRDAFGVLPELATLLFERDLGDSIFLVARKKEEDRS
jgi:2-polyprenyl-3-methyl-5-hydroxy-6-metoxy-1,4-benzoquinol methylase